MAIIQPAYSANTAITLDLSGLTASSTFVAGRESTEVDNTTTKYIDAIVNVDPITSGATIAIGQMIQVFVWGNDQSIVSPTIDVLDGLDSVETLSHVGILNALKFAGAAVATAVTASQLCLIMPFSVAAVLGLPVLPKFWGLYVAHNHGSSLAAAQSGLFSYNGITYTSV